jgi:sulfate-transporting ATPase
LVDLLQFAILGLGGGAVYALLAQGIIVVYRGSGILNFAHGAMAMFGSYLFAVWLTDNVGLATLPAAVLSVALVAAIGVAIYWGVMRPLRRASPLARLIATLGVLITLQAIVVRLWGSRTRSISTFLPQDTWTVGDVSILEDRLILVAIAAAVTLVLWLGYRYTRFGLATTGAAENSRAAAASGYSPDWLATVNWALGGALAGVAGMLVAPLQGLNPTTLTFLVISALAVALIAGFTSFPITLFAGLAIGVVQSEMAFYVKTQGAASAVPLVAIILVLVVRGRALPLRSYLFERLPELSAGRVRARIVVPVTAGAVVALLLLPEFWADATTTSITVAIVMLSVVVLTGYTGQLNLAPAAFGGIGAFFAAKLVASWNWPFAAAIVIGVLGSVVVGLVFAIPALRTRGVNLAVVTLGFGIALNDMLFNNQKYTGGATDGIKVGPQKLFGVEVDAVLHPRTYAILCVLFFVLTAILVANVRRSRAGRRLIAVRTNERAAAALGVNVFGAKIYAFAVSAAVAGLGGILIGFRAFSVTFGGFDPMTSILIVGYTVIGGVGYVIGPLFGSTLVAAGIGSLLNRWWPGLDQYFVLIGGVILILLLIHDPNGLASGNAHTRARLRAKLPRRATAKPPPALPAGARHRVDPSSLDVASLGVRFGGVTALDDVDLRVGTGEIVGLIGPNGAGKTTLVDAVTGFVRPAHGDVRLNGRSIRRWSAHRRARAGLSRSYQSLELFEDLTVRENLLAASDRRDLVGYFSGLVRPGKDSLRSAAMAAVHEFGLDDDLDRRPPQLPYGRRSLVAIARAVAVEPSILLLDEPAAGLDDAETAELASLVRRLRDDWGIGILLIEHDMSFVMSVCDRIVVLDFGRVIAEGTPAEIQASERVRAAYLGDEIAEPAEVQAPATSGSEVGARG